MAENWGGTVAGADTDNGVFGGAYEDGELWFSPPDYRNDEKYTLLLLKPWIMNLRPGSISALADKFHNAYTQLGDLAATVRTPSTALYTEGWTQAVARDSFMRRGPGTVLAYLEDW